MSDKWGWTQAETQARVERLEESFNSLRKMAEKRLKDLEGVVYRPDPLPTAPAEQGTDAEVEFLRAMPGSKTDRAWFNRIAYRLEHAQPANVLPGGVEHLLELERLAAIGRVVEANRTNLERIASGYTRRSAGRRRDPGDCEAQEWIGHYATLRAILEVKP